MYYPKRATPTRGIIIVDTSALINLAPPLPEEFLTSGKQSGAASNLLFFLAGNGYRVEIPEMVAHECGNFTRDGKNLGKYFPGSAPLPFERMNNAFMRSIGPSEANIAIVPPPSKDTTPAAELIRSLWEIHDSKMTDSSKRGNITFVRQKYSKCQHYGDIAAAEMVRHMPIPEVPVFYLSDDMEAFRRVRAANPKVPVNHVNSSGLYNAIRHADLLDSAGFKDVPFQRIFNHTADYLYEQGIEDNRSPFHTQVAMDSPPNGRNSSARPFYESLSGLREEIERKGMKAENIAAQAPCEDTAMKKFQARFAAIGRINKTGRSGGSGLGE